MKSKKIIKQLEAIMEAELANYPFPSISDDRIAIKDYAVIETKRGFRVVQKRQVIADTFFKKSAVAIAICLSKGQNNIQEILELDDRAHKHYTDVQIFQNTIKNTTDEFMRESRRARISKTARYAAFYTKQIEKYIYRR